VSALESENVTPITSDAGGDLAIMLTGGGARAAYQVGLIKGIARHFPNLKFQIVTGVSAGAINAVFLAARKGSLERKAADLEEVWRELECSSIWHFDWKTMVPFRSALASVFPGHKWSRPRGVVDTLPLARLLSRLFDAEEPIFSPDGSRIAYVSSRPRTPQIYSSNLDGTDEQVEAPASAKARVYHTSPDWSPDGRMIAYQQQDGDFQIWIVNRADRSVRKVTTQGENEDPSWAPDARHIALTSNRGGAKEIWVLDTQSKRFRQLTTVGNARLAAWSGPITTSFTIPLATAR